MRLSVTLTFSTFAVLSGVAHARPINEEPHLKLIRILPVKVPGFAADEPAGSSTQLVGGNMAEASRTYHRGTGSTAQQVTVKIIDGASSDFFPKGPDPSAEFGNDDADSPNRTFTLDGFPALERYDKDNRAGSLMVFVGGRYLVEIQTEGIERKGLLQWWRKLSMKALTSARH